MVIKLSQIHQVINILTQKCAILNSSLVHIYLDASSRRMIEPPNSVKQVIEKTVHFVQKNGPDFEKRLQKNSGSSEKFKFFEPNNEYHEYYMKKLNGELDDNDSHKERDPTTRAAKKEYKPFDFHFITKLPLVTSLDLDIIKLTAVYTAINGDNYVDKILESRRMVRDTAQFEFLNKRHSLHSLFEAYVEQYRLVLDLFKDRRDRTEDILQRLESGEDILKEAASRAVYEKKHKVKAKQEREEEEQKKFSYASINWQDFSIVGKVDFGVVDQVSELPASISREDLLYRTLEAKHRSLELSTEESVPSGEQEIESAFPVEEKDRITKPKGMKIKAAGTSRLKNRSPTVKTSEHSQRTIICPLSGKLIPELKFDEHLRTLLRDPRYREQQDNYIRKNFTYAPNISTDEVYENIKRLARKRANPSQNETETKRVAYIGPQE